MRKRALGFCFALIAGLVVLNSCKSRDKDVEIVDIPDSIKAPRQPELELQSRLKMNRSSTELGFTEKRFNPCEHGWGPGDCAPRYFSVIHFQLLCRDSEGTVSTAPVDLKPINSASILWKISNVTGTTSTDHRGYGQFTVVSPRSTSGQRLMLRIGPQFMGFTASEITRIVLPKNFCT